jgi:hypothetical protein
MINGQHKKNQKTKEMNFMVVKDYTKLINTPVFILNQL